MQAPVREENEMSFVNDHSSNFLTHRNTNGRENEKQMCTHHQAAAAATGSTATTGISCAGGSL